MELRHVDDEYTWDIPLARSPNSQFLQSWAWGVFQQTLGRSVVRLQAVAGDEVCGAIQLVEHGLPFGRRYRYAPRGPVYFTADAGTTDVVTQQVCQSLRTINRERPAVFFRGEPVSDPPLAAERFSPFGFRTAPTTQPADELAVTASVEDGELLAAMHEKTRYNIRLAERHGVRTRLVEQVDYARRMFPMFWGLLQDTAQRQRIRTHPRSYYLEMLQLLMPRGALKLMVAEHGNQIVAGHLLTVFGDTIYYLHGGSSYEHRALMAPFALHREGVRLARRLGKTYYNLGGVAPVGAANHPWQHLTRFKEGFAAAGETGRRLHYAGAFDLVFQPLWYRMYATARRARQLLRFR